VAEVGKRQGSENLLAAMQVLDQTLSRLRYSTQGRILAELALVRLCNLDNLAEISTLIGALQLGSGLVTEAREAPTTPRGGPTQPAPAAATTSALSKKKDDLIGPAAARVSAAPAEHRPAIAITPENAASLWNQALASLSGVAADQARHFDRVATLAPNRLAILFKPGYTLAKSVCERPEQLAKFEQALANVVGRPVEIEFRELQTQEAPTVAPASTRVVSPYQRLMQAAQHPMVRLAGELLGAHPARLDEPQLGASAQAAALGSASDLGSGDFDD